MGIELVITLKDGTICTVTPVAINCKELRRSDIEAKQTGKDKERDGPVREDPVSRSFH